MKEATVDAAQIEKWWRSWPDSNVGIVTGPSGLVVIDVDGDVGRESLAALRQELGDTWPARCVESLTGKGSHFLFSAGGATIRPAVAIRPGLDVRAGESYIVAPPSVHVSGRGYAWEVNGDPEEVPLAMLPPGLVNMFTENRGGRSASVTPGAIIPQGNRNAALASLAGSMRHRGMTGPEILAALLVVNCDRCQPPLKESEVRDIAASVSRYEPANTNRRLTEPAWPSLDPTAYTGLPGEVVRFLEPETEADPAAILAQMLVAFGNVVGRGPHWQVEADKHYTNLFAIILGPTGEGRKGVGVNRATDLFRDIDSTWKELSGLSSGEGVISFIRDPVSRWDAEAGEYITDDPGVEDKRMLVIESEFATVLRRLPREGSSLSPIIRDCWDGRTLQSIVKHSPQRASNPHVSIIGHITPEEMRRYLDKTEMANGFANRFLFIASRRSKLLPFGGELDAGRLDEYRQRIWAAVERARGRGVVPFDAGARMAWPGIYEQLCSPQEGMIGALTARAAPHVRRLALVYALMDAAPAVTASHLRAGLAVWRYSEATCRYVFGESSGNPDAERLFGIIAKAGPEGIARTELHAQLGRNWAADRLDAALRKLLGAKRIIERLVETGGRRAEVYEVAQ